MVLNPETEAQYNAVVEMWNEQSKKLQSMLECAKVLKKEGKLAEATEIFEDVLFGAEALIEEGYQYGYSLQGEARQLLAYTGSRYTYVVSDPFTTPNGWIPDSSVYHKDYPFGTVDYPKLLSKEDVEIYQLKFIGAWLTSEDWYVTHANNHVWFDGEAYFILLVDGYQLLKAMQKGEYWQIKIVEIYNKPNS